MFNNIYSSLEQLGLTAQKRALHIQFSNSSLNSQVFLQRIDGQHAINQGVSVELICLSTNALLPLKQFIGCQVAVDQVTDSGELFRSTGIITAASQGQSDGALTVYKLQLEDATSLWHKRRNSRVFMNKSVLEITQILFSEWQSNSALFAASLTLDSSGLSRDYDVRPFSMQANETDYAYLTRLWRSEGINWLIDESSLTVSTSNQDIQPQKLRLIDSNSPFQRLSRGNIRFHRSHATEQSDSITSLIAQRQLQSTAIHLQRWQADSLSQEQGSGSVLSSHQHSSQRDNDSLSLEQAWTVSPAWISDLNGEDQTTASGNSQLEQLNQQLSDYQALQAKSFIAHSTVRDAQVGYRFELDEHPEIDQQHAGDKEFLILSKQFYNQNNLPKELNQQIQQLLTLSHWNLTNHSERQGNQLTLIRSSIKVVPEYDPNQHRPMAHVQRAKVVGPSGESIHVDAWGRIKVRFLFTRTDDHSHDGGAGANDNDTDSAWVDVLTSWAGEGYGARFHPRVGEIVVIDFFDGNIDRPFVTGRIHEAERNPTKFDIKGQLPDTKQLSGIRSQEVDGAGFNQLRFDDTTGQISTQLHSSHGATQLNLGNLSHPKEQATSDGRGEGFELRTDQYGAVRAGQGLLLSSYAQDQAEGQHLNAEVAQQQLQGTATNSKALSDIAKNQQTDAIESVEQLQQFAEQLEKDVAKFKQALILLSSPNSIGLSTAENIHLSADAQINHVAGDSINLSTQNNLITHAQNKISQFAAQGGIKQVAAKGKVELQAQNDGLDAIARKGIQITSTEDSVYITASKEIVLVSDTSQVKINGSGVFVTTGSKFEVKAGQHVFTGGASVSADLPALPVINLPPKELELQYLYSDLKPVAQAPYKLIFQDGTTQEGVLDSSGYAKVQIPANKIQSKVYYGFSNIEAKPDQPKQQNNFKDKKVMSIVEAEQLIEQYNKQELDHLLDEYFPDEIQAMIDGQGVEYDDHINDYVEKDLEQHNNSDDAIADHAKEIPLNEQSTPHLGLGGDA